MKKYNLLPSPFFIPDPGARRRGAEQVGFGAIPAVCQKVLRGVTGVPEHHIFDVTEIKENIWFRGKVQII